ncbi:MAG: tryptophan synthase subunit alpha [Flavobacteriaceae bacterium]|nr:tryptophan synthase subunit alpha [Flavobacteriaceae bacterium]
MGYFNPIMQFGVEKFCEKCSQVGIDGLIIPDLPLEIYQKSYQSIFKKNGLYKIFLITPQTSGERINLIDSASNGFIYMVSSSSVTGTRERFKDEQINYFKRIKKMRLKNPTLVGFGVSNSKTFKLACENSNGAIIGSAFIKFLEQNDLNKINYFVSKIKGK